jgi:hemerythrin-like metal-binding protein
MTAPNAISVPKGETMKFFTWKDSFAIGIEKIDQQHKVFLEYLNECYQQASRDSSAGIDHQLHEKLREYASTHFRFEESLLQARGYPNLEFHIKQHKYFESQIEELDAKKAGGRARTTESLFVFLRDWFLCHILEDDKKFVPFIMEGQSPPEKPMS